MIINKRDGDPYLMRSELIDEVMHVYEEKREVVSLLLAPTGFRHTYQHVQQVNKVHDDGVVQFTQLSAVVVALRV